jgi:uncharacterized phiE125 gp8 family phage protein
VKNVTTRTYSATDYITIDEVKSHLRITSVIDDGYISNLLNACFDYGSRICGYELRKSTVEHFFSATDSGILHIPARILSVTNVKYRDSNGDLQTLSAADYDEILTISADYGYDLTIINEPSLYGYGWKYKVTVVEGFAKGGDTVDVSKIFPDGLRTAIYLLCEHFYTQRGSAVIGTIAQKLDYNHEDLFSQYAIKEFV